MAAAELKIIRERAQLRRLFTRTATKLEEAFTLKENLLEMKADLRYLDDKYIKLKALDKLVQENILSSESYDERVHNEEMDNAEKYELKYVLIKQQFESFQENTENKMAATKCTRNFNLPKLEIKRFNDDPKTWIQFWGQYQKIHEDDTMDDTDKFQYLVQSLDENSNARVLVESFPPSKENYKKAVEQLKTRFGKKEVLIEIYIRELLGMVLAQAKGEKLLNIRTLYDRLTTYLQALETLGVSRNNYDAMLFPLIESAMPEDILLAWSRSQNFRSQGTERLGELLEFLNNEVNAEERIRMARPELNLGLSGNDVGNILKPTMSCFTTKSKVSEIKSKDSFIPVCLFCDRSNHTVTECSKAGELSLDVKKALIKKKGCCFICLKKGHMAKKCKTFVKCLNCKGRHLFLMCPNIHMEAKNELVNLCHNTTTLLQTLVVNITHNGRTKEVRAMLDSGSQRTYIQKKIVDELNMKVVETEMIGHTLFGGVVKSASIYKCYSFEVSALDKSFKTRMTALEQQTLCGKMPRIEKKNVIQKLHELNISLSDNLSNEKEIGLLIGLDYLNNVLSESLVQVDGNLCAMKTRLGWVLQGPTTVMSTFTNTVLQSYFSQNNNIADLWDIELLGIKDPVNEKELSESIKCFEENITRIKEGRYKVKLLWKENIPDLSTNYDLAYKRMVTTTKKLKNMNYIKEYDAVFEEWKKDGIIEEIQDDDHREGHYLPHHPVIKMSSNTTKIRPVFDASAKDKKGWSLNDCMDKGINMIEVIPKLLINFRRGAFGITSDIKKAFLNISLEERDRNYVKFVWWDNIDTCKTVKTYRHQRVVFGVSCSPFLLAATINYHLDKYTERYKDTAIQLKEAFYVDNCIMSVDSEIQMKTFIAEAKELMSKGKFDLCEWATAPKRINDKTSVTVLGMCWDTIKDNLQCNVLLKNEENKNIITKRNLLSITQQIFDPLGLISPVTLVPKLITQRAWLSNTQWDQPISTELENEFKEWKRSIHLVNQCHFPRRLTPAPIKECETSIHLFSDASKHAYAGCIFLRTQYEGNVYVQLVMAKSRVAPTKRNMSLPRLELMGALISSRLYVEIMKSKLVTECKNYETYCWTDSSVVLAWLRRHSNWKPFVSNRVTEICKNTQKECWYHLPGDMNPADLPSRGCNTKVYLDSRWWEGPQWLKQDKDKWPKSNINELTIDEDIVRSEEKKEITVNLHCCDPAFSKRLMYFSKYSKIVKLVAWMLRMNSKIRRKHAFENKYINCEEYKNAERILIILIQTESFEENRPKNLYTILDEDGIMKIKTRLEKSHESKEFIYPILLPGRHEIIKRMVIQRHISLGHAGSLTLMNDLRKTYWILNIRRLTKKVISQCIICKRLKSKHYELPEAPLPMDRIEGVAAFQITGIDLAGPLYLRDRQKCWIVLFTCATYRAVHLELVESLSTPSFIMALRRFISRRGRISVIYTDNGTNFQGTANLLSEINWPEVESYTTTQAIRWKFNPPGAPWWGGWWERLIRTVKEMLQRILGRTTVTWIELSTILCDCEAVINSRPLTYITISDDTLKPLTPQMFIQNLPGDENADLDQIDEKMLGLRYKYLQKLRTDFRQRFRNEYLSLLISKGKQEKSRHPQVGDIVLIDTNVKRLYWPLGVIKELYVGGDGNSRVARLQTATGDKVRPVQRLYPLELSSGTSEELTKSTPGKSNNIKEIQETVKVAEPIQQSRHGRLLKIPRRFLD